MSVSTFQKLLEQDFTCAEFFANPQTIGSVDWTEAKNQAADYRDYIRRLPIDNYQKISSYVLSQEDTKTLLSQNNGRLDGLRVYLGKEDVNGGWIIKLYIVGCRFNRSTNQYEDFNLPLNFPNDELSTGLPMLGEVRPCPDNCGSNNFMNHP